MLILFLRRLARRRILPLERQVAERFQVAMKESELRRTGEILLALALAVLGAILQSSEGDGSAISLSLSQLSLVVVLFAIASSVVTLVLYTMCFPVAQFFAHVAAVLTMAAIALLAASAISSKLRWLPFAVFFNTFLFIVCFRKLQSLWDDLCRRRPFSWWFRRERREPEHTETQNSQTGPVQSWHVHGILLSLDPVAPTLQASSVVLEELLRLESQGQL